MIYLETGVNNQCVTGKTFGQVTDEKKFRWTEWNKRPLYYKIDFVLVFEMQNTAIYSFNSDNLTQKGPASNNHEDSISEGLI